MLYSFGGDEEKREYADVVVSRLRNLVALEPILVEYVEKSGGSNFQNQDLRQIISRSQQFRDDLLNTNHSPGKDFFRFINALFESIDQKSDKLIQSLEFYQEASTWEAKSEHSADILKQVEDFNEDLLEKREESASRIKSLKDYYRDSDYIFRSEDWGAEQQKIGNKICEIMETLGAPLIEEDMIFGDYGEEFDNESSLKAGCDWDLAKASGEYLKKMNSFKGYAKDYHKEIDNSLRLLTTHLVAHDTLINLRRERREMFEAFGKEEAFSFQPPRPPSSAVSALFIKDGFGREAEMKKGGGKVELNADDTEIIH
jgi:hypothetical protein